MLQRRGPLSPFSVPGMLRTPTTAGSRLVTLRGAPSAHGVCGATFEVAGPRQPGIQPIQ